MAFPLQGRLTRLFRRRTIKQWRKATRMVDETDIAVLADKTSAAKKLSRNIQAFRIAAETRLSLPRGRADLFPTPAGTDWRWRPKPWRAVAEPAGFAPALSKMEITNELVIFHDCPHGEVSLYQKRNLRDTDLAPYGVSLEAFHFAGSYLSLVIEVPAESCEGLKKRHLIRLSALIERERPSTIYARLNVKNGPNTEQVLLTLPDDTAETMVEFDLAYTGLNEKRAERMWVDLLIENPAMNKIDIRDLTLCRYLRADF